MEFLPKCHMGRNTFFAMIFLLKYIFSSNFKYKIPDIQLSNGRKEKGTFPWYFFQKIAKICNISIGFVFQLSLLETRYKAKEKYRGVFETQKSGDKTSPGEIYKNITNFYMNFNLSNDT